MAIAVDTHVLEKSGTRRLIAEPDPSAVSWWIFVRFPDGHVFARGGRCRTSKLGRSLIHRARIAARVEHEELTV